LLCTITQSTYSNANKRFCTGIRIRSLVGQLLDGTPLVLGKTGRSLTIVRVDSQCVINKLPGGGPSDVIPAADYTFTALCGFTPTTPSIQLANGRIHNHLLGQNIALGLNLRLSPNLGAIVLTDRFMTTIASTSCDEAGVPIPGTESTVSISQSVLDALNSLFSSPTIVNLFELGNRALGGLSTGGAALNQISSSIAAINQAFDGCRFLVGFSASAPSASRLIIIDMSEELPTQYTLALNYPNPFNPSTTIEYAVPEQSRVTLKVYNVLGEEIAILMDGVMEAGYQSVTWNAMSNGGNALASGVYICRMHATSLVTGREFARVQKMLLLK